LPLVLKTLSALVLLPVAHGTCFWHELVPLMNTVLLAWIKCVAYVPTAYFRAFGAGMVAIDVEVCLCWYLPAEAFRGGKINK